MNYLRGELQPPYIHINIDIYICTLYAYIHRKKAGRIYTNITIVHDTNPLSNTIIAGVKKYN